MGSLRPPTTWKRSLVSALIVGVITGLVATLAWRLMFPDEPWGRWSVLGGIAIATLFSIRRPRPRDAECAAD